MIERWRVEFNRRHTRHSAMGRRQIQFHGRSLRLKLCHSPLYKNSGWSLLREFGRRFAAANFKTPGVRYLSAPLPRASNCFNITFD